MIHAVRLSISMNIPAFSRAKAHPEEWNFSRKQK
jgi:hypothetical protein